MSRERFLPIKIIAKSSNVIMYGAGKIGRKFLQQNKLLNWCNIYRVVDSDYKLLQDFPIPVENPATIQNDQKYDYVLIAVVNETAKNEITKYLNELNVPKEKIIDDIDFFIDHDVKDNVVQKVESQNEDRKILKIGFLPGGVMGDNVICIKLYQKIVEIAPNSEIDVFTTFWEFPEIVFYGQKNLNGFIHRMPNEGDYENYDFIIQSHFEPSLIFYNRDRVNKLNAILASCLDKLLEYQEKDLVECSVSQYMNRIQWDRAKFNGWTCYTLLGSSGAFEIDDWKVDFPLNRAYEKRFQELDLGPYYITYNFGASDPLKNGKRQTKMWPYEYHEELNKMLKCRFPQIPLIQIGAADVSCVPGADKYILGENLEVTKYILKNALCHIDCEGGLVHIATQLGTKCFVIFGPTPVSFFGYDVNTNFVPKTCGECCGMLKDWYTRCYKYEKNECMYSTKPGEVFEAISEFVPSKIDMKKIRTIQKKSCVTICAELTGGLGDYIITKKMLEAILKVDCNVEFILLGKTDYLETVYWDWHQVVEYRKAEIKEIDKENYDIAVRITHLLEIKWFDEESVQAKSQSLFVLFKKLMEKKEEYWLYNDDQSYIDAVNLKRAKYRGLNRYTIMRHNGLLEIEDTSVLIELREEFYNDYVQLNMGRYITINRGADVRSGSNNQTKVWSIDYYNELVSLIKTKYPRVIIVQLGLTGNEKLNNVDFYMFDKNIELIKYILKNSVLHIDGEGGLVHLATQLGTKCAVLFGPTPEFYYGYEQNINIVAQECGECMGVSTDWFVNCYKGDIEPRCMKSITPRNVLDRISEVLENF